MQQRSDENVTDDVMYSGLFEICTTLFHAVRVSLLPCLIVSLASLDTTFEGDYRFGPCDDVTARDVEARPDL